MGKYVINVNYDTRNSLGRDPDQNEELPIQWDNLEIAKENLKWLKEHKEYFENKGKKYFYSKESELKTKKIIEDAQSKPWYIPINSLYSYPWDLNLKKDNGDLVEISMSFCMGYFDSINYMEITSPKIDDSDLIVYF